MTAKQLLEAAREGKLTAAIASEQSIDALADAKGPDCYPTVTIDLACDGWEAQVEGWKVVCWCRYSWPSGSPLDNGDKWQLCTDDSDGANGGLPRAHLGSRISYTYGAASTDVVIFSGDNVGIWTIIPADDLDDDEREELAQLIQDAIDSVYDDWEPEKADDKEIRETLVRDRHHQMTQWERDGVTVELKVYAAMHMGRAVYAVEGDDEEQIFWEADEAAQVVRHLIIERLEEAIRKARESLDAFAKEIELSDDN